MRRLSCIFTGLLLALFLAGGALADSCPDTCGGYVYCPIDGTQRAFESSYDVDLYQFFANWGTSQATVKIYTTGATDTVGSLYDGSCNFIAENDDISSTNRNFQIIRNLTGGTYNVLVRPYNWNDCYQAGCYYTVHLEVTSVQDPHGDTCSTAYPVALNSTTSARIDPATDWDYFILQVSQSGTLTISTTGTTDTYGYLKNVSCNTITENDDQSSTNRNFKIVSNVTAGTYYVAVKSYAQASVGDYSLVVNFSSGDDHANTCTGATVIAPGPCIQADTKSGNIDYLGDSDYFRVNVACNGTLTAWTNGSMDTLGRLLNANCTELASNDDQSSTNRNFKFTYPVTVGTYYVAVQAYNHASTGSYTLQLVVNPSGGGDQGGSCSTASPIGIPSTTNASINPAGDWDYFKIQPTSAGTLTAYTTGSTDTFGYLKNSSCTTIASNDDTSSTNTNFRISKQISLGTYYIAVKHYSASQTGNYTLNVSMAPTDDHGNTCTAATTITQQTTAGVIGSPGDIDYFKLVLPTSGPVSIYTTGTTDTYGYLKNANCVTMTENDDISSTDRNFRIVQYLVAGTYYIAVRHYYSTGTGSYTLVVAY